MNLVKSNWFLLILLSAIWGGAFTLNKMALDSFTPEVIVAGRLISGSVFLVALIYFLYKRFSINLAQVNYYLFMSLVGIVIPFIAIITGQKNIDSAMAGILMATMPISTILLSHLFLDDEKMNKQKFIGFIISFLGVFILIYRDDLFIDNSISETFGVGTRIATPSNFPLRLGIISPIAFDAPVDVGTIDWLADRALLGSL